MHPLKENQGILEICLLEVFIYLNCFKNLSLDKPFVLKK